MDNNNKETYIDFTVISHALVDALLALYNYRIKKFSITKEDGCLYIIIPKSQLMKCDTREAECYE